MRMPVAAAGASQRLQVKHWFALVLNSQARRDTEVPLYKRLGHDYMLEFGGVLPVGATLAC